MQLSPLIPYIALLVVLFSWATPSFASNIFSEKLKLYECPTETAAMMCTKCRKLSGKYGDQVDSASFEINAQKSLVMVNIYSENRLFATDILENCSIINESNWICREKHNKSEWTFSYNAKGMTKGQYYEIRIFKSTGTIKDVEPFNISYYVCGK